MGTKNILDLPRLIYNPIYGADILMLHFWKMVKLIFAPCLVIVFVLVVWCLGEPELWFDGSIVVAKIVDHY